MKRWSILILWWLSACGWAANLARGRPEWRTIGKSPSSYGLAAQRVDFESADHLRVAAWWIAGTPSRREIASVPPADACELSIRGGGGRATVVLVHGVGGNRGGMLARAQFLVAHGYNALSIDLRAHGESEGAYPSPGYLEAAEVQAAVAEATRHSPCPVVLLGHSVGGVAVLHAASHHPAIAGVVADSAFVSSFDMFDRLRDRLRRNGASVWPRMGLWFLGRRSLAGMIDTLVQWGGGPDIDARKGELVPVLPAIDVPVMFVTGTSDDIAPSANTHAMARLVRRARVVELAATHFTYDDAPHDYESAVLGFLSEILTRKPI